MENESMPEMNAPESSSTPPSNHVPKAMLWVVIVAIIAIALVVLMVFWMNKTDNTNVPSVTVNNNANEEMVEQEVIPDDFEGWVTKTATYKYDNEPAIDFSIKIPESWISDNSLSGFAASDKGTTNGFNGSTCRVHTRWDHGLEGFDKTVVRNVMYKSLNDKVDSMVNSNGVEWSQITVNGIVFEIWATENPQDCYNTLAKSFWSLETDSDTAASTTQNYTNADFSIDYPKDWELQSEGGEGYTIYLQRPGAEENRYQSQSFTMMIHKYNSLSDLSGNSANEYDFTEWVENQKSKGLFTDVSTFLIDGGVEYRGTGSGYASHYLIYLEKDGAVYEIRSDGSNIPSADEQKIIDSFRFID